MKRIWQIVSLGVVMMDLGCGELKLADLTGNYRATHFIGSGDIGDILAQGGSIQIVLQSNGTTSGAFTIPPALAEGDTLTLLTLSGTFTLAEGIVTFEYDSDTFIRDTNWEANGNTLEYERNTFREYSKRRTNQTITLSSADSSEGIRDSR